MFFYRPPILLYLSYSFSSSYFPHFFPPDLHLIHLVSLLPLWTPLSRSLPLSHNLHPSLPFHILQYTSSPLTPSPSPPHVSNSHTHTLPRPLQQRALSGPPSIQSLLLLHHHPSPPPPIFAPQSATITNYVWFNNNNQPCDSLVTAPASRANTVLPTQQLKPFSTLEHVHTTPNIPLKVRYSKKQAVLNFMAPVYKTHIPASP